MSDESDYKYYMEKQQHVDKDCSCYNIYMAASCMLSTEVCFCDVCKRPFYDGDYIQSLIPMDGHGTGVWTNPSRVDCEFQERFRESGGSIGKAMSKHSGCSHNEK